MQSLILSRKMIHALNMSTSREYFLLIVESFGRVDIPLELTTKTSNYNIFFEIQLMELGIEWKLADRSWANPDFEIEPPARICSHIIKENCVELYLSTIWQDEYSLSDIIIQRDMSNDCVKFLPVSHIAK